MSTLYKTNMRSWIFIVLAHWNNILSVDMSTQLLTLSWFKANQSLLLLRNTAYDWNINMWITYHFQEIVL
jgi:hypothetical protein